MSDDLLNEYDRGFFDGVRAEKERTETIRLDEPYAIDEYDVRLIFKWSSSEPSHFVITKRK